MGKLTIIELAPYLPYGLTGICTEDNQGIETVSGISWTEKIVEVQTNIDGLDISGFKPILRPISDLTKEIEFRGDNFYPADFFEEKYTNSNLGSSIRLLAKDASWINHMEYIVIIHLLEWHFDVFGLIDKNIAIDINSLTQNP